MYAVVAHLQNSSWFHVAEEFKQHMWVEGCGKKLLSDLGIYGRAAAVHPLQMGDLENV